MMKGADTRTLLNPHGDVRLLYPSEAVHRWTDSERFLNIIDDPWVRLFVKLQHLVTISTYNFWVSRNCMTMHLPITTHAVSSPMGLGSDSRPVRIELFGKETFLADSMQFMLEYGCRFNPAGCFYVMPSFRGEDADSTHLCQFYHSEVELCVGLEQSMQVADEYFRYLTEAVLERYADAFRKLNIGSEHMCKLLSTSSIPRLRFDEAARILGKDSRYVEDRVGWRTLTRAGEIALLKHCNGPVWVTHWDHLAVPFYQAYADESRRIAANADFLIGVGEVIGLGERHQSAPEVSAALDEHGVDHSAYQWYLGLKESKPLRTSGFGMGVERFLLWVLRHAEIRDLQVLPRFNGQSIVP